MTIEPRIVAESALGETSIRLQLQAPADLMQFDGHFDGSPILPGVAQIDWAVRLARERLPLEGGFSGLSGLKFMRVIEPEDELELDLEWQAGQLAFRYRCGDAVCSQGRVLFRS